VEWRLFPAGTVPEWTTADWYAHVERAPHLEEQLHLARLHLAADFALSVPDTHGSELVDLGAGDGGLLSLVRDGYADCWGYDLVPANIDGAQTRGVRVSFADVTRDPIDWARVAVCTEMLEHLTDPHGFLRVVQDHADWLVCSSPYTETADFHYGHHAWAWDLDGYRQMLEAAGWIVMRQETIDMFQVVLAR
jgi:2-polyprenyl-3-methyl-5-hydroxy-6-metoxy-1,4-benzoquinol methylase